MFVRAAAVLRERAYRDLAEADCTHGIAPWPESHKKQLRESAARDQAYAIALLKELA